jgi:hypothetical protein
MRTADGKLPFTSLDKLEDSEGSSVQRRALAGRVCLKLTLHYSQQPSVTHVSVHRICWTWSQRICNPLQQRDALFVLSTIAVDRKPDTAFRSLLSIFIVSIPKTPIQPSNKCDSGRYRNLGHAAECLH